MAIQSMTGFARITGSHGGQRWAWEIRSVNGKGLDIRFRLPQGHDALELKLREIVQAALVRGNLQATLQIEEGAHQALPRLNEAALEAILDIANRIAERTGMERPGVADLMAIRGIVEIAETGPDEAAASAREEEILGSFAAAIEALAVMRRAEGAKIAGLLADQVSAIEAIAARIEADPSRSPEAIRERLARQVSELAGNAAMLDAQRLHQEAAILATRSDLREELDRLAAHVEAARALLSSGGAIGRKLDFLAQEFNRECNTICSKSNAVAVTTAGLEMKAVIDQFREQVQNLQ